MWIHEAIAEWIGRLLCQRDDEIHCQKQDRRFKNWHPFVFYDNKLSNFPLSLTDASHSRPQSHDHSDLRQGSRALAGPDFLSTRRVFVSHSQIWREVRESPSSETQGLLVGTMRYFRASDIFDAKVCFKGWRAPGHFFLPNEFQKWRNPYRWLARKIFFWPINEEI